MVLSGRCTGMPGVVRQQSVSVSVRRSSDSSEFCLPWEQVTTDALASAAPWRTFRWHHGQRHFSGTYWSVTERGHVIYESRLELTRLSFADFDASVSRIIAQPFLLKAQISTSVRRHVPDFLLRSGRVPTVVDVKPYSLLSKPEVSFTLGGTRELIERRGWDVDLERATGGGIGADLAGADLSGADLGEATWPKGFPVPGGWVRDPDSGR